MFNYKYSTTIPCFNYNFNFPQVLYELPKVPKIMYLKKLIYKKRKLNILIII